MVVDELDRGRALMGWRRAARAGAVLLMAGFVSVGWLSSAAPAGRPGATEPADHPLGLDEPARAPRANAATLLAMTDVSSIAREAPRPTLEGRNPFTFGAPPASPRPVALAKDAAVSGPEVAGTTPAAAVDVPPPTLAGITKQEAPDGQVRTAVLMTGDTVQFALETQVIDGVYRVTRITDNGVLLVNIRTAATSQLVLQ